MLSTAEVSALSSLLFEAADSKVVGAPLEKDPEELMMDNSMETYFPLPLQEDTREELGTIPVPATFNTRVEKDYGCWDQNHTEPPCLMSLLDETSFDMTERAVSPSTTGSACPPPFTHNESPDVFAAIQPISQATPPSMDSLQNLLRIQKSLFFQSMAKDEKAAVGAPTSVPPDDNTTSPPGKSSASTTAGVEKALKKKAKHKAYRKNRPMSAYNFFFKEERARILGTDLPNDDRTTREEKKMRRRCPHNKIGFSQLGKMIGAAWKSLGQAERAIYEEKARVAKECYIARKAAAEADASSS